MALQKGNYSEPHAQNRIFDALLLLMWLLLHVLRIRCVFHVTRVSLCCIVTSTQFVPFTYYDKYGTSYGSVQ